VLCFVCCFEALRTYSVMFIPSMSLCNIYMKCLRQIKAPTRPINQTTFKLYDQLRIIHRSGEGIVKVCIQILMGTGYILCLLLNCFTLVGWKIFSLKIYVCAMPITFVIYFVIGETLPKAVYCFDFSYDMIRHYWAMKVTESLKNQLLAVTKKSVAIEILGNHSTSGSGIGSSYALKQMKRLLQKQRPIIFHSGDVAKLNKETELTFYESLFYYTVTLLIICESVVKNLVASGLTKDMFG